MGGKSLPLTLKALAGSSDSLLREDTKHDLLLTGPASMLWTPHSSSYLGLLSRPAYAIDARV